MPGFHVREIGIEFFQPKGQLVGVEALGAAPELAAPKRLDDALETLDLIVAGSLLWPTNSLIRQLNSLFRFVGNLAKKLEIPVA